MLWSSFILFQEDAGVRAKLEARVTLLQEELQAAEEALDRNGEASDEVADLKERLADRTEQIERLSKQLGEKNEELEQVETSDGGFCVKVIWAGPSVGH